VQDRLAQTDNVRAALALVASGAAPAGIVYATDARAEPRACDRRFAPDSHPPIVYPLADIAPGRAGRKRASAFLTGRWRRGDLRSPRVRHPAGGRAMTGWLGPEEWQAVALSLRVAFWATALSLPFGILVAYALSRWRLPGKALLNGLVHLPLVLPPVVTGFLLLIAFGPQAAIGRAPGRDRHPVAFRWTGAALAAAVMAFPLMVRAIRLSLDSADRRLEEAAGTLGASPVWVFLTVTLPLSLPGIVVGAILAFAKAMGEFGATITFVSNIPGETRTVPSAIYAFLQVPGGDAAAWRLVIVSVVIAMGALILSELISRRVASRVGGR
jgi:molybdate transport system permease protein